MAHLQNVTLLKKVEELTLYLIDQDKKIEVQSKLIEEQQAFLEEMKTELIQLKKKSGS